jgi:hypothetical protein
MVVVDDDVVLGMIEFVVGVDRETDGATILGSTSTLVISNRNVTPNDDVSLLSFNNTISDVISSCVFTYGDGDSIGLVESTELPFGLDKVGFNIGLESVGLGTLIVTVLGIGDASLVIPSFQPAELALGGTEMCCGCCNIICE